jgi:formyltetrahydrofolate-dependent phosphoribosylglycinamide formyltransferase
MVKKNTCVFISGQGSNLKNLILHSRNNNFPINISLVISNNKKAYGINHAKKYKIPYIFINTKVRNYENKILLNLKRYNISFICLAGYMKIISHKLIKNYKRKIINIHPSLLPKFKGLNTFSRMLKNREKKGGCTVHYVDEKLDNGEKIIQKSFFIDTKDNEINLKNKTQKLEYKAFPEAIIKIFRNY